MAAKSRFVRGLAEARVNHDLQKRSNRGLARLLHDNARAYDGITTICRMGERS